MPVSYTHLDVYKRQVYRLSSFVTAALVPLLPLVVTLAGALVLMFKMAPMVAVCIAVLMPVLFVLLKLLGRKLRPLGAATMQAWADQSALAEQNLELLPVIKAFATEAAEGGRYRAGAEKLFASEFKHCLLYTSLPMARSTTRMKLQRQLAYGSQLRVWLSC